MSKKVAVILSGSGVYDGAEIHESVITLLRLDQRGAQVQCFAPNISQLHVINHLTGEEMPESRNVLVESARIARGIIKDIREADVEVFDALIVPGGFGAATNLSNFAIEGAGCTVQPDVLALADSVLAVTIAPLITSTWFRAWAKLMVLCDEPSAPKPRPWWPTRSLMIFSRPAKAPATMNSTFVVSIWMNSWCGCLRPPCGGTLAVVPSRIFSSACCTPSPDTSRVIEGFSLLRAILSTSSM